MQKYLLGTLAFIIVLSSFYGCQKSALPVPEYPIDTATVAAALEESGLPWTIAEEDSWFEGQTVYTLNKGEEMIAVVSSGIMDGERLINVTVVPYYSDEVSLPEKDWEKTIVFATLLYGSFESSHQVYDTFINEYDTVNTVTEQHNKPTGGTADYEEHSKWKSEINSVDCKIYLYRPWTSMPEKYLMGILLASDMDTFFPDNKD